MHELFMGDSFFNQPLNNWDVSKVDSMMCMFWKAIRYKGTMKNWKLKQDCNTDSLLLNVYTWHLFNTVEDLPMQNGKRIDIGDRKTWKLL